MEIDKKIILKLTQALEDLKKSLKGIEIDKNVDSAEEEIEISGTVIKSPIVGTAYLAPEPGGKKFAEVGKKIKKGDTIMIVEAMKTMNHIPSSSDGVVKEVCVEDGQPVEFGQKIAILE
jgi:acetyl-CoA carboxylase biotin carboxyl carrier protein